MSLDASMTTLSSVVVVPWPDPVVEAVGHDPRGQYVELFWLPVLGPSTVWLHRRLVAGLDDEPDGYDLDLQATAHALGLANQTGRHGPFMRSLGRLVAFGMATPVDGGLAVRRRVPYLHERQVRNLPPMLQQRHSDWVARDDEAGGDERRRRAYSLALTLVRLGEEPSAVEAQLCQWRFPAPLADDAVRWAASREPGGRAA